MLRHGLTVLCVIACSACSSDISHVECDCMMSGLQIYAMGNKVAAIQPSGPACTSYDLRCGGQDRTYRPGCDTYYLWPAEAGDCQVDVALEGGGTRSKTFKFSKNTGDCCPGVYVMGGDSRWDL